MFNVRIKASRGQGTGAAPARQAGKGGVRLRDQEPEASHELQVDGPAVLGTPGVGGASDRDGGVVAKRRGRESQPRVGISGDGPPVRQSSCRHGRFPPPGYGQGRTRPTQPTSLPRLRRCAALWPLSAGRGRRMGDCGSGPESAASRVQAGGEGGLTEDAVMGRRRRRARPAGPLPRAARAAGATTDRSPRARRRAAAEGASARSRPCPPAWRWRAPRRG